MIRHFIDIGDCDRTLLLSLLDHARKLKQDRNMRQDLFGKTLAMVFEKPSLRTRISFELAMHELGGHILALTGKEIELGQRESIKDTAHVMGRFVHAMMVRTFDHDMLKELAAHAPVPVINGLTNTSHPCQIMADLLTVQERVGRLDHLNIAWLGDGNNVLNSWIEAAGILKLDLHIGCPAALVPQENLLKKYQAMTNILITHDADAAIKNADVVITDTWTSMHHNDAPARRSMLAPYQVNSARMALAKPSAIFLHCLPAHRGEEVTDAVIDSPQSFVIDEAENRLHAQKAILLWCFGKI
jgi:ornithine carbamoyltransferase